MSATTTAAVPAEKAAQIDDIFEGLVARQPKARAGVGEQMA